MVTFPGVITADATVQINALNTAQISSDNLASYPPITSA